MSATEIIEQIKVMPAGDREKVFALVDGLRQAEHSEAVKTMRGEKFEKIMEYVFTEHAELMRRLAQ